MALASRDKRISYSMLRNGEGVTLLFIHGWCGNQTFWKNQIVEFETRHSILTIDLVGSGNSCAPESFESIYSHAKDIRELVEHLDLKNVVIIGHSMGGPIALEAAILLGKRCRLVVGVDTFTDRYFYNRRSTEEIEKRCIEIATNPKAFIATMVENVTSKNIERRTIGWIANEMMRVNIDAALATFRGLLSWDIEERWAVINCPIEAINSAELVPKNSIEFEELSINFIDDCGHFPMIEKPRDFNRILEEVFVRR